MRKILLIMLTAVLGLSIGGCSAVQLAYNHADWWLTRQFNHYFNLDSTQRAEVRSQIQQRLQQHRQHELADVVGVLEAWYIAFEHGLDHTQIAERMAELDKVVATTLRSSLPLLAGVMTELNASQQAHFAQRLERMTRDFRRRHAIDEPPQRRAAHFEQRLLDSVEDWTGTLSGTQRAQLSAHIANWPNLAEHWLAYREHKQRELLALLRSEPPAEAVVVFLTDWLDLVDQPNELRVGNAQLRSHIQDFLLVLDESLSSTQRQRILSRLDDYRVALAELLPEPSTEVVVTMPPLPGT